jgi:hypothetical protein
MPSLSFPNGRPRRTTIKSGLLRTWRVSETLAGPVKELKLAVLAIICSFETSLAPAMRSIVC